MCLGFRNYSVQSLQVTIKRRALPTRVGCFAGLGCSEGYRTELRYPPLIVCNTCDFTKLISLFWIGFLWNLDWNAL